MTMIEYLTQELENFGAAVAKSHHQYVDSAGPGESVHPATWFYEVGTLIGAAIFLAFIRWKEDQSDQKNGDPGDLVRVACDGYAGEGPPVHELVPILFQYADSMFKGNPKDSQIAIQDAIWYLMNEAGAIKEQTDYPKPSEPTQKVTQEIIRRVLEPSLN